MMSRAQENRIEQLALAHGRVFAREGFVDGHVDATVPSGACFRIADDDHATVREAGVNFAVDWSA